MNDEYVIEKCDSEIEYAMEMIADIEHQLAYQTGWCQAWKVMRGGLLAENNK